MALIKAAFLDERGVFQGIVEVDESAVTAQHLVRITECDLPAGQYRWQPDADNPEGGAFVPLPREQRAKAGEVTLEQAIAFDLLDRHAGGARIPDVTLRWLDRVVVSIDFGAFLDAPLVTAYAAARGLTLKTKG